MSEQEAESIRRLLVGKFRRKVGAQFAEDLAHEVIVVVLKAELAGRIALGDLQGYAYGVTKFTEVHHFEELIRDRNREADIQVDRKVRGYLCEPHESAMWNERFRMVDSAVAGLPQQQRDIFLMAMAGEDRETIQREMGLSRTQERLMKNRTKDAVAERVRRMAEGEWAA